MASKRPSTGASATRGGSRSRRAVRFRGRREKSSFEHAAGRRASGAHHNGRSMTMPFVRIDLSEASPPAATACLPAAGTSGQWLFPSTIPTRPRKDMLACHCCELIRIAVTAASFGPDRRRAPVGSGRCLVRPGGPPETSNGPSATCLAIRGLPTSPEELPDKVDRPRLRACSCGAMD